MSKYIVILFPFAYIFCFLETPPLGTIDQLLIVIAAFFVFCENVVNQNNYHNIKIDNKLIIIYFLYCVASLISIYNNPESDLSSIYHSITILVKPAIILVVFFALNSVKDLRLSIWSMVLFVIVVMISTTYMAYNFQNFFFLRYEMAIEEGFLGKTVFSNPNVLTRAVILFIPIIYVYSFYVKNKLVAHGLRLLVLSSLVLPVMGISRATMISMTLVLIVMFWRMRQKFMILAPILILIAGLTISQVHTRFAEVLEKGYAVGHRDQTAEASLKSIQENPIFGRGLRTVQDILAKYGGPTVGAQRKQLSEHNIVLRVLLETGIVGLTLLLLLFYFYVRYMIRNIKKANNTMLKNILFATLMGFFGFLLTTFTGGSITENILWYQVGIAFAVVHMISVHSVARETTSVAPVPYMGDKLMGTGIRLIK